jgi:hypothetical protein
MPGGFFLGKKPLELQVPVKTRIENAGTASTALFENVMFKFLMPAIDDPPGVSGLALAGACASATPLRLPLRENRSLKNPAAEYRFHVIVKCFLTCASTLFKV